MRERYKHRRGDGNVSLGRRAARGGLQDSAFTFVVWFEPLKFVSDDGGTLRVRVPNALFRDWFALHHAATLNEALARLGRPETRVELLAGAVQEEIEQS
jgi:chromosomal replication initiation ATPase DnaA